MSRPIGPLHQALSWLEQKYDTYVHHRRLRKGHYENLELVTYRGFGNEREVRLKGRVLCDLGLEKTDANRSRWGNLQDMIRRFETDEVPGVTVRANFQGKTYETISDGEGYVDFTLTPHPESIFDGAPPQTWREVEVIIPASEHYNSNPFRITAEVLIPSPTAEFGVISDVDDTILVTDAARRLKMLANTFLRNALTRLPFEEAPALYRTLHAGVTPETQNPIFYLSSSPWNLYDFMVEFFAEHELPKGPFILRDLGLDRSKFLSGTHGEHKSYQIEQILALYNDLPFLLIGDSGERDPFIFTEAVEKLPGRIKHIYIRDVAEMKGGEVAQRLQARTHAHNVEITFFKESDEVRAHAQAQGWIR